MEGLRTYGGTSALFLRQLEERWLAWSRFEQQSVFDYRPKMQYMWLALGAVFEGSFTYAQ